VEFLVEEPERLTRAALVERGARALGTRRVPRTTHNQERSGEDEKSEPGLPPVPHSEPRTISAHGTARCPQRTTALVTLALFWNRISPVSAFRTCMNSVYCTRRSSSLRSSLANVLPVTK